MADRKMSFLVVGDIMVDRYTYVSTNRQAPEAKIPVWDVKRIERRLGGAANVARNIKALGRDDVHVSIAGISDGTHDMFNEHGIDDTFCVRGETMYKDRFVDESNMSYLFRCDNMKKFSSDHLRYRLGLIGALGFDAVVFSDYDKGTITEDVFNIAKRNIPLVVVDSKRFDLGMYRGSNILKVNEHEYATQAANSAYPYVEALFDYVVVTKGDRGAQLLQADRSREVSLDGVVNMKYTVHSEDFPTIRTNAIDVTGCGDTHTAAMAFSMVKNNDIRLAVKFANECARSVVQKFGTSAVDVQR